MTITLNCGCVYSHLKKGYIRYCRTHFQNAIDHNIQRQKILQEQIIQQHPLRRNESTGGLHLKNDIFGRTKKYHLKPLF